MLHLYVKCKSRMLWIRTKFFRELDARVTQKSIKILIICAAGMSSSLLIDAIEKAGKEEDLKLEVITYHSIGSTYWDFGKTPVDVVLIAPQIRFLRNNIAKLASPHGISVKIIDPTSYGMTDGQKIVQQILEAVAPKSPESNENNTRKPPNLN
jgi:PTS system cellobiose-specific IIB component